MNKFLQRKIFDVNVGAWRGRQGGGLKGCWIEEKREENEEYKDELKVNEESDAFGEPFLGSRHTYKCTQTP